MSRRLIRDHWHRGADGYQTDPCAYQIDGEPCGQSHAAHVQGVGEWMEAAHWFRPWWLRPSRCARCGRHASHGTHYLTRRRIRLYGWAAR